ncbi:MAG: YdcF family protein [Chitinophagales bacterium]
MNYRARLLFLVVLGSFFTACTHTKWCIKKFHEAEKNGPYDAVIVPGTPYGDGALNPILAARILWAKMLFEKGITKHIIYSGAAVGTPYYEGMAMKIISDSLGVPSDKTFAEIKAEHSVENAYYGWQMAKSMGFKKIALATDPFQTIMLGKFGKKRCNGMPNIPVVYHWLPDTRKPDFHFPNVVLDSAFVKDFIPLNVRESGAERYRGTRGKHIKFEN